MRGRHEVQTNGVNVLDLEVLCSNDNYAILRTRPLCNRDAELAVQCLSCIMSDLNYTREN